jgi:hypothetical protein
VQHRVLESFCDLWVRGSEEEDDGREVDPQRLRLVQVGVFDARLPSKGSQGKKVEIFAIQQVKVGRIFAPRHHPAAESGESVGQVKGERGK